MSKILFLTLHRKNRSPGQRFRHEQYLDYLESNGHEIVYSNMLNAKQDRIFYEPGNLLGKMFIGFISFWKRLKDIFRASKFDYIFIFRDAFFFGFFFEWLFKKSKAKLIFDFDDSIYHKDLAYSVIFQQCAISNWNSTTNVFSYNFKIINSEPFT